MEDNNALNDMVEVMMDVGAKQKKKKKIQINKKISLILISLILVLLVAVGLLLTPRLLARQKINAEPLTTSTLEKIVASSELSTYQALYNGVAEIMNEEKPDELDYRVSYEAKVNVGFDFKKVEFNSVKDEDDVLKKITVVIPNVDKTDVSVIFESLKFMFQDDNKDDITEQKRAYKACIADAEKESEKVTAIKSLAEQNAINIIKALIGPFIENQSPNCELEIVIGGVS